MPSRTSLGITDEAPIGPGADLERHDVRLEDGSQLADEIVDQLRRSSGRPSLSGRATTSAHAADVTLDGRGLTLLPTAWGGGVGAMWDPPWQPALTYPARGTSAARAPLPDSLGRLLGRTRAELLAALAAPATTSGLALRCGVPLSTASDHLAALRHAGLTTAHRTGHALQHRRTDLGDALLSAAV